jgi:hypothetical protein
MFRLAQSKSCRAGNQANGATVHSITLPGKIPVYRESGAENWSQKFRQSLTPTTTVQLAGRRAIVPELVALSYNSEMGGRHPLFFLDGECSATRVQGDALYLSRFLQSPRNDDDEHASRA